MTVMENGQKMELWHSRDAETMGLENLSLQGSKQFRDH
jgi:hypothetical protein